MVLRLSAAAEVEVEGGEPAGTEEEGGLSLIAADQSCSFTDITVLYWEERSLGLVLVKVSYVWPYL